MRQEGHLVVNSYHSMTVYVNVQLFPGEEAFINYNYILLWELEAF